MAKEVKWNVEQWDEFWKNSDIDHFIESALKITKAENTVKNRGLLIQTYFRLVMPNSNETQIIFTK